MDEPCVDCPPIDSGVCWWDGCPFNADRVIKELGIGQARMKGAVVKFFPELRIGDVYLCGGHFRTAERTGRVSLSEEIVEWAAERAAAA